MTFLYKIYSGYDGFSPRRIPDQLLSGNLLRLGWTRYLESVEVGDEVWIYFHGPHRFKPGVYVKGFVRSINPAARFVLLRVRQSRLDEPLTDADTSRRAADTVSQRGRQVFLFPPQWVTAPHCTLNSSAESCANRLCGTCPTWNSLPFITPGALGWPARLPRSVRGRFVPAYRVIPSRCYLYRKGSVHQLVSRTSDVFMRFKTGEQSLAYPLALGIYENLSRNGLLDFGCVVPIPLSPDKVEAGEIHRTRLLACELGQLLGVRVMELLSLRHPISKRRLRTWQGYTASQFETAYANALQPDPKLSQFQQVLLVDDVCTEGSTLRCAIDAIRSVNHTCAVVAATAGQMIVKAAVADETGLLQ